jgi:hypothetical protein
MRSVEMRDTGWFKSTFSGAATDNCVEVRITGLAVRVRDSKNPGRELEISPAAFAEFVAGAAATR